MIMVVNVIRVLIERLMFFVMIMSVVVIVRMLLMLVVCRIVRIFDVCMKFGEVKLKLMIRIISVLNVNSFCCVFEKWFCVVVVVIGVVILVLVILFFFVFLCWF